MAGVIKKVVHAGRSPAPEIVKGSKVTFHFQTRIPENDEVCVGEVLDDSRKFGQPFELLVGKEFKLEVWESAVRTMAIGEVASFRVQPKLVTSYPFVSKTLRDMHKKTHDHTHTPAHTCCGMMMSEGSTIGYKDLDQLMKEPKELEFVIELLSVEHPGDYRKETWQMEPEEKLSSLVKLREEGNDLYRARQYPKAAEVYGQALGRIEQLQLREKPGDPEWLELDAMQVPFLLNYGQCKFQLAEYYEAIEHLNNVLKRDPVNVKALFRRGQANAKVWNISEAKCDFADAQRNDPTLKNAIDKEIKVLDENIRTRDEKEKERLKGKLFA